MAPISFARLREQVERDKTVNESSSTLIAGLREQLQAAIDAAGAAGVSDEQLAEFNSLVDQLAAQQDALATAVAAGTVAENETPGDSAAPSGNGEPAGTGTASSGGETPSTENVTGPTPGNQ